MVDVQWAKIEITTAAEKGWRVGRTNQSWGIFVLDISSYSIPDFSSLKGGLLDVLDFLKDKTPPVKARLEDSKISKGIRDSLTPLQIKELKDMVIFHNNSF
jgi:hypothetical protein